MQHVTNHYIKMPMLRRMVDEIELGKLSASNILRERVCKNPNIKIIYNVEILEMNGTDKLESLLLLNDTN